jgi:hypothetical protein
MHANFGRFALTCITCVCLSVPGAVSPADGTSPDAPQSDLSRIGHSHLGPPFDFGPREKPWPMTGIGEAHFPITTKNPEVQRWFDQGNALLHSFWDYEAERSFRWCLKLEPGNAMAYWGLARASALRGMGGPDRARDMIRLAVLHKSSVSEREQLYIDALAARLLPDPLHDHADDKDPNAGSREREEKCNKILETICVKYPDDMEARALLALYTMGDSRYGAELKLLVLHSGAVGNGKCGRFRRSPVNRRAYRSSV